MEAVLEPPAAPISVLETCNAYNNIAPDPQPDSRHVNLKRGRKKDFTATQKTAVLVEALLQLAEGKYGYAKRTVAAFPDLHLDRQMVHSIMKVTLDARSQNKVASHEPQRNGRAPTNSKCSVRILKLLYSVDKEYHFCLPYENLTYTLNLRLEELDGPGAETYSRWTVRSYLEKLQTLKRREFVRPKLTYKHRLDRLEHVLTDVVECYDEDDNLIRAELEVGYNIIHIDEKWFFMVDKYKMIRIWRGADGTYKRRRATAVRHKSHIGKLMFICAIARPIPAYGWDGKISIEVRAPLIARCSCRARPCVRANGYPRGQTHRRPCSSTSPRRRRPRGRASGPAPRPVRRSSSSPSPWTPRSTRST